MLWLLSLTSVGFFFWSRVASALCLFFLSYFIYVWNIITLLYKYISILYFLVFVCVCTPVYIYTLSTYFFSCYAPVFLSCLSWISNRCFINFVFAVFLGGVCSTFCLVVLCFPSFYSVSQCQSQSQSYFTTDGQSVSMSWCRAQSFTVNQIKYSMYNIYRPRSVQALYSRLCPSYK
jgi:hypothetical protein